MAKRRKNREGAFSRSAYSTSGAAHSKHARKTTQAAVGSSSASGVYNSLQGEDSSLSQNPYSRNNNPQEYVRRSKLQKKKAKRKKVALVTVLVIAVLALGGVGAAWAYMNYLGGNLNDGIDEDTLNSLVATDTPSDPFYMLLIGTDKSAAREESNTFGGSYRTDSMILTRVDPKQKTVTMVSIPRDTQIQLEGHGTQKINAAYAFGGPAGAIDAVSDLAGVEINHYAEIDFDGFKAVVDALGGIEVDVAMEINDDKAGGHVDAGKQTLNGKEALILCRSRHAYDDVSNGDAMRAANQRLVLSAIINKVLSSDIGTMTNTVNTLTQYVTTDMSVSSILGLAQSMLGMNVDDNVYTASVPTTSAYEDNLWYEKLNEAEWREMMERVDAGLSPTEEDTVDPGSGVVTSHAGNGGSDASASSSSNSSSSSSASLSKVQIAVKNGAGIQGCASQAANKLTAEGAIVETGNADDYNYKKTIVVYNNASEKATAEAIADTLGVGTVKKNNGVYSYTGDYLVVIGADWQN